MAAGEPKFSHITVTPDEDDDVVIQAGARPARPVAPTPRPDPVPAAPSADEASAPEPVEATPSEDEGYRETTLDDLKAVPMPVAQKIVLALGVVGVIAVVAWYLFLR